MKKAYRIVHDTEEYRALSATLRLLVEQESECCLPCKLSMLKVCLHVVFGVAAYAHSVVLIQHQVESLGA